MVFHPGNVAREVTRAAYVSFINDIIVSKHMKSARNCDLFNCVLNCCYAKLLYILITTSFIFVIKVIHLD